MSSRSAFALTAAALVAFAANSLLCRLALRDEGIGPATFALLRLVSGAVALLPLAGWRRPPRPAAPWSRSRLHTVAGPATLCLYAVGFSYAYVDLDAGTGAVLLFGAVQVTMLGFGLLRGERLTPLQWVGAAVALAGVWTLLGPRWGSPSFDGALLMLLAGVGWGVYSILGRGAASPAARSAHNFVGAAALSAVVFFGIADEALAAASTRGVVYACVSGAVTSGLGYVVWYAVLPHLRATTAAIAQLSVPVLAALGGVTFLGEALGSRLVLASLLTLGGVALTLRPAR